jgi:ParB family chromosome partitioning protein
MTALFDTTMPAQGKSNEWYTPSVYIEAARAVMGSIELDPASCEVANRTVKATRYYSKEDDGLSKEWYGHVWLNPPYGRVQPELTGSNRSFQHFFSRKCCEEYTQGHIEEAILLLHGYAVYKVWFQRLFFDVPFCLHKDYIPFIRDDGKVAGNGYGGVLVYLGPHEQKFIEHFSPFGRIAKAIDTPCQPLYTPRSLWEVSA